MAESPHGRGEPGLAVRCPLCPGHQHETPVSPHLCHPAGRSGLLTAEKVVFKVLENE